jgi:hypothetical protein
MKIVKSAPANGFTLRAGQSDEHFGIVSPSKFGDHLPRLSAWHFLIRFRQQQRKKGWTLISSN